MSAGAPPERLDAESFRRWLGGAVHEFESASTTINALNVFPVPDRDTGTNMLLTLRSAAAAADEAPAAGVSGIADAAATGALCGACGSSGVILAGYLRGLADGLLGRLDADAVALAGALGAAAASAHAAVSRPLEGTILSVARAAAVAAGNATSEPVATVTRAAAKAAAAELACTTAQVPALAAAGVVDAGGQGLVLMLDVLADVTNAVTAAATDTVTAAITDTGPPARAAATAAAHDPSAPLAFAYEVQYTLEAPAAVVPALRARLDKLGDSVAVSTGADRHNVHVHVNDVGAAIEAALDLGRPSRIRVTRFSDRISGGDV